MNHEEYFYGTPNPFAGLLYCSDCGSKMYLCRAHTIAEEKQYYNCSLYRKFKSECKSHRINLTDLEQIVLEQIRNITAYARDHEGEFVELIMQKVSKESASVTKVQKAELKKAMARITQIDAIIQKMYEDNVLGKISDERYSKIASTLESEQATLQDRCTELNAILTKQEEQSVNIQRFLDLVHRYTDIKGLDAKILNEFIEKIYVSHPIKINGQKTQTLKIVFNCIGEFNIPPKMEQAV